MIRPSALYLNRDQDEQGTAGNVGYPHPNVGATQASPSLLFYVEEEKREKFD